MDCQQVLRVGGLPCESPRLQLVTEGAVGKLRMIPGGLGVTVLESSVDLKRWIPVRTNGSDGLTLEHPIQFSLEPRFYRLVIRR